MDHQPAAFAIPCVTKPRTVSIILSEVDPVGGFIGRSISDPVLHGGLLLGVFAYMVYLQASMAPVSIGPFLALRHTRSTKETTADNAARTNWTRTPPRRM
jgi:hypothetical protein